MIKTIEIKNFKSWRNPGEVRLAPVTLILGTNSSGKSSLLQTILLLKQTAFSADRSIHLNLGGDTNDHIDLGSFNTLLHHDADPPRLGVRLHIGDAGTSNELRFEAEYQRDSAFNPVIASVKLANQDHEYRAIRRERAAYSIYHGTNTQAVGKSRSLTPERSIAFSAPQFRIFHLASDGSLNGSSILGRSGPNHYEIFPGITQLLVCLKRMAETYRLFLRRRRSHGKNPFCRISSETSLSGWKR